MSSVRIPPTLSAPPTCQEAIPTAPLLERDFNTLRFLLTRRIVSECVGVVPALRCDSSKAFSLDAGIRDLVEVDSNSESVGCAKVFIVPQSLCPFTSSPVHARG